MPTQAPHPVVLLIALGDAAARRPLVSPAVDTWLVHAVRRYLQGGITLDQALGLRTRHWPASTVHLYAERDAHLQEAARLLDNDAAALALEVNKFEDRTWPVWRSKGAPPPSASPVQRELFAARSVRGELPNSYRQLLRICKRQ